MAIVSLEAYGIYQPPPAPLPIELQSLALSTFQQPQLSDFEVVVLDGSLGCSRHLLEARWPWFAAQLASFTARVGEIADAQERRHEGGPSRKNSLAAGLEEAEDSAGARAEASPSPAGVRSIRVLSPRRLVLPARRAVAQTLIEFIYTLGLVTPAQRDVRILRELLALPGAAVGEGAVPGLKEAIVHVLHEKLDGENVEAIHVAASLAGSFDLQVVCSSPAALRVRVGDLTADSHGFGFLQRCQQVMMRGAGGRPRSRVGSGMSQLTQGNGSEVSLGSEGKRSWRRSWRS